MIVNLISCPRNISTALMYSFAQHSKTKVIDEPFYAHYLAYTGINHPGREEIMISMPSSQSKVLNEIKKLKDHHEFVFIKNMAHHHDGLEWKYLTEVKNVFLIRDPKQLITSFAEVIPNPTLQDIGLKYEAELLDFVVRENQDQPIVVDSEDILKDPQGGLSVLCSKLGIPFEMGMLSWEKGPIPEDGVWAKYWYKNVHDSTGFVKQKISQRPLREHCRTLYEESMPYYEKLRKLSLNFR